MSITQIKNIQITLEPYNYVPKKNFTRRQISFEILCEENNRYKIIEYIKNVPKTELHLHIEGTLEPELMFKLAKRNNVSIPYKNIELY